MKEIYVMIFEISYRLKIIDILNGVRVDVKIPYYELMF